MAKVNPDGTVDLEFDVKCPECLAMKLSGQEDEVEEEDEDVDDEEEEEEDDEEDDEEDAEEDAEEEEDEDVDDEDDEEEEEEDEEEGCVVSIHANTDWIHELTVDCGRDEDHSITLSGAWTNPCVLAVLKTLSLDADTILSQIQRELR